MLADGEAEDVGLAGEGEAVAVGEEEGVRIVGLWELERHLWLGLHCSVVREDSLLLELEFLEDIWLEGLLGFCEGAMSMYFAVPRCTNLAQVEKKNQVFSQLTSPQELNSTQCNSQNKGVGKPFPLADSGAQNDQASGDINPIDVLLRSQRFLGGHGGRLSSQTSLGSSPRSRYSE